MVNFRSTVLAGLCAAFILYPAGCRNKTEEFAFKIRTDSGFSAWRVSGSTPLVEGTYQDRGQTKQSILIEPGPGAYKLTSPPVAPGAPRTL